MARVLPGLRNDASSLLMTCPAPGVLVTQVTGHGSVEVIQCLMQGFETVAAEHAPVLVFHDWYAVTGYDSAARDPYVRWAQSHRQRVEGVHLLVRSKVIAMVVSVANLRLGFLHSYSDQATFQAARAEAVLRRSTGRR